MPVKIFLQRLFRRCDASSNLDAVFPALPMDWTWAWCVCYAGWLKGTPVRVCRASSLAYIYEPELTDSELRMLKLVTARLKSPMTLYASCETLAYITSLLSKKRPALRNLQSNPLKIAFQPIDVH